MTDMNALAFTAVAADTGTTRLVRRPVPEPGPGQVSLDVHYAGVNFADVMLRRGDVAHPGDFPLVPGLEAAGIVRAAGAGVTDLAVGDRVAAFTTGLGAFADVVVVPAATAARVPDTLDLAVAAAAPAVLATAVVLLDDVARLRAGDSVFVHSAAGGVGRAVAQLARSRGAGTVVGGVGAAARVDDAKAAGYDPVLVRGEGLAERVLAATGGRGADVVLDTLGIAELEADLAMAAPGARIVIFGNAGAGPMGPLPTAADLMARNVALGGFSISSWARRAPERVGAAIGTALGLLADGTVTLELTIGDGLESAARAQQALAEGRGRGKHVVRVRG